MSSDLTTIISLGISVWIQVSALLPFSLQICEDFWVFLSFPSDRNVFCILRQVYSNTAIAENAKRANKTHELLTHKLFLPPFDPGLSQG